MITISGFPAAILQLVFIVLFSAPIWVGAKFVGAERTSFLHAVAALAISAVGAIITTALATSWAIVLVPLSILLSLKFVLKTSFFGAIILAIVAAAGYFILGHLISSGFTFSNQGINA